MRNRALHASSKTSQIISKKKPYILAIFYNSLFLTNLCTHFLNNPNSTSTTNQPPTDRGKLIYANPNHNIRYHADINTTNRKLIQAKVKPRNDLCKQLQYPNISFVCLSKPTIHSKPLKELSKCCLCNSTTLTSKN